MAAILDLLQREDLSNCIKPDVMFFDIVSHNLNMDQQSKIEWLYENGFTTLYYSAICVANNAAFLYEQINLKQIDQYDIPFNGVVVKVNRFNLQQQLGANKYHLNWGIIVMKQKFLKLCFK
uniref:Uncharacterized protein n=1 Tax=Chlorodesmis fastigiata TaxID=189431 RepID=A0A2P0QIY9_CHLFS|nr:hypothetical protein [Chlorodesmis fastigiata]ARO74208.1 hypothetical protein [Chlorodesmis fastigiata]